MENYTFVRRSFIQFVIPVALIICLFISRNCLDNFISKINPNKNKSVCFINPIYIHLFDVRRLIL